MATGVLPLRSIRTFWTDLMKSCLHLAVIVHCALSICTPVTYNSSSYSYCIDTATREQAEIRCTLIGSKLLVLETSAEFEFWVNWLNKMAAGEVWVGATWNSTYRNFVWDKTKIPVPVRFFGKATTPLHTEDCVNFRLVFLSLLQSDPYKLDIDDCKARKGYICEKTSPVTTREPETTTIAAATTEAETIITAATATTESETIITTAETTESETIITTAATTESETIITTAATTEAETTTTAAATTEAETTTTPATTEAETTTTPATTEAETTTTPATTEAETTTTPATTEAETTATATTEAETTTTPVATTEVETTTTAVATTEVETTTMAAATTEAETTTISVVTTEAETSTPLSFTTKFEATAAATTPDFATTESTTATPTTEVASTEFTTDAPQTTTTKQTTAAGTSETSEETTTPDTVSTPLVEPTTEIVPSVSAVLVFNTTVLCVCGCRADVPRGEGEKEAFVEEQKKKIQAELNVDKETLSATVRKKISYEDSRPSVSFVGYAGVAFICVIFGTILLLDMTRCVTLVEKIQLNSCSNTETKVTEKAP